MKRNGFTLIELIIAVLIIATLIGLLLPAVQKVRQAAGRIREGNKFRQFALACQSFADAHGGQLPNTLGVAPSQGESLFQSLIPYLEMGNFGEPPATLDGKPWRPVQIQSEFDPSFSNSRGTPFTPIRWVGDNQEQSGDSSYAFNHMVFNRGATLTASVPDGTSQTLAMTTHYARCGSTPFTWGPNPICHTFVLPSGSKVIPCWTAPDISLHTSSFADDPMGDAMPPGVSKRGDLGVKTFQVLPLMIDCDYRVPQALLPEGLMVARLDGSVNLLRVSIDAATFWGLVSPAGGEVLRNDW
ncbi:hypothetical protein GobsT_52930 [Gemmata obscuriglobus]|uniref:Prepilin-type cleavage/methylation domain-containing protein n=1 Tax=Gemmata obscuriglobus TaxID=114 RepID=A0A2Z3GW78_9BACT|nr:prepilin-type N-terminal cleavage/methylation domain-containing protein [Gemmata obscuriglobus]AWM36841.1 prepilin-type cleavage/methylation domain-containing protein [Gemmata obscuriglobus]QEG30488.1 hypothetical protein GobsT_52930 [Gemmata obscuriglobus]VTS09812.1 Uncharacterized protein OS=Blastopirellula marina DSM 3645 GN=DSM3645_19223 PE=4 SV=1 [Gemmata obscuriglobus UQM 2246]